MKLPARTTNSVLAVLVEHSGYASAEEFASAINTLGWQQHGLKLFYDHTTVKRWLRGVTCQQPDLVAAVLSRAWNIPIPVEVIWPQLRQGRPAAAAHVLPCVAARTLEELATYIGGDMLTRRQVLAEATQAAVGAGLADPLLRYLAAPPVGLTARAGSARTRITSMMVGGIEQATAHFGIQDAAVGGGLSREAAVGQLKLAVDLLRDASYTDAVGNRMLAAVAELAGMVGWMSHDVHMDGPAQRYFVLGLQAARESRDPRALLVQQSLLADLARQMHALGQPATGLRLVQAALDLPRGRHPATAAMLWNLKARMLAALGAHTIPEIRHAVELAVDLLGEAEHQSAEQRADHDLSPDAGIPYTGPAELAGNAALAWLDAARQAPPPARQAAARQAEQQALFALASRPEGFTRSRVFDLICLASSRFILAEADQAATDGNAALDLAAQVANSSRVLDRLGPLLAHSAPHAALSTVGDFRGRLLGALAAGA
jgi:hypothetical protein